MARKAGILLVVAALVGSAVTAAAPADADTVVDLSGSAPAGTHGPGAFTVEYDIYAAGDLPSAVLTTHQDSALPALAGAVTLDGTAVPDAHVSSPDPGDLSIALGTDPSGTLPGGSHIVTFTVTVGTGDTTDTSSDATLTWGDSGTVTSEPVKVEVNQPDVYSYLTAGDDAAPAAARAALPHGIVGVSCYATPETARAAAQAGADYVGIGSVFASATKPGALRASLEDIARARRAGGLPVAAIGGITAANVAEVAAAGADMAAVISALFDAPDVAGAARALSQPFRAAARRSHG
jgi:hypothetical protein